MPATFVPAAPFAGPLGAGSPGPDGLLLLVVALALVALIIWLAGRAFGGRGRAAAPESAAPDPRVTAPAPGDSGGDIPGPVLAVIAAAVQIALQDEHFIIHGIRTADPREGLAWSTEGRRSIYASKNLR